MPTLRDIKRRRASISNLKKITGTMHMISSIRFKKAQDKILHFEKILENLGKIMSKIPEENQKPQEKPPVFIIISSDRGMAGAYNINILNKAYERINKEDTCELIILGRKARSFFNKKNIDINTHYTGVEGQLPDKILSEITTKIIQKHQKGSKIFVAYTHFHSISHLEPKIIRLLPTPTPETKSDQYIYEPEPNELLEKLLAFYAKMSLEGFYFHSHVAENAARMLSMEKATENADELLDELEFTFHQRRKDIITREIAEIVSGAQSFRH